jgi:hypothetical protein
MLNGTKCFACGKPLRTPSRSPVVVTADLAQGVQVGPDCFKQIQAAGDAGYQPPKGGPRLLVLTDERELVLLGNLGSTA